MIVGENWEVDTNMFFWVVELDVQTSFFYVGANQSDKTGAEKGNKSYRLISLA